ncbi:hypothetical protein J6590_008564 [Homalodisca vitripennis]|nr:hypothetical protein J6590_008564 [Homalodisca vitripennis]
MTVHESVSQPNSEQITQEIHRRLNTTQMNGCPVRLYHAAQHVRYQPIKINVCSASLAVRLCVPDQSPLLSRLQSVHHRLRQGYHRVSWLKTFDEGFCADISRTFFYPQHYPS